MSVLRSPSVLRAAAAVSGLLFVPSAFLAWAAGSDFAWRGCRDVGPESWPSTANCSDAHAVAWSMGLVAGASLLLGLAAVWRLAHV